jgi:hypothetical protein
MSVRTPYEQIAEKLRRRTDEPSVQPTGTPPQRVAGGFGTVPAAPIDTTKGPPAPKHLSARDADRLLTAELLQAARDLTESTSALTARIGRQGATNGVLDVVLATFPASGLITIGYPVAIGSLVVVNHHAADGVTVHSGQAGLSAPAGGRGVQLVAAGVRLVMPIGDRSACLWGTAGGRVSVQAYTGLQPFGGL